MNFVKVSFELDTIQLVNTVVLEDRWDYGKAYETFLKIPVGELLKVRNEQEFLELHRKYRVKETVG